MRASVSSLWDHIAGAGVAAAAHFRLFAVIIAGIPRLSFTRQRTKPFIGVNEGEIRIKQLAVELRSRSQFQGSNETDDPEEEEDHVTYDLEKQ